MNAALFIALARLATACGDAKLPGTGMDRAQLVLKQGTIVHMGEAIGASLILPKDAKLETGTMLRSGCSPFHFKVEPETGWHDPWADWYYSGIPQHASAWDRPQQSSCGVIGGRIGGQITIEGKVVTVPEPPDPPPQIAFSLNDWVRFDNPGKYTISLTYRTRAKKTDNAEDSKEEKDDSFVTLQTDSIEIEVLPEPAEASRHATTELAAYTIRVRKTDPAARNSETIPYPIELLYSQAEGIIPSVVQLYKDGWSVDQSTLLNAAKQRALVEEMEHRLHSADENISDSFVHLLAFSKTRLQHPDLFGSRLQNPWTEQWAADSHVRNKAFLRNLAEYTQQLLVALPKKSETAQGDCLKTVLQILAHWPLPNQAELRQKTILQAARLLPTMKKPPDLWEEEWQVIASPAMVSFLLKTFPGNSIFATRHRRWLYQVAPVKAQQLMIEAMEQGDWSLALFWGDVVRPNLTVSGVVDSDAIDVLSNDDGEYDNSHVKRMLLRFGTREAAGPVRKILTTQECLGDPILWAFLLKVDGAHAEQELVKRFRKASATSSCLADETIMRVVDELDSTRERPWAPYWSPVIEGLMISELANKRKFLASQAAELLGLYGASRVEDVLWAKLEAWHLSPPPENEREASNVEGAEYLEGQIINALLYGRGWTAHNHIARLRGLCVYACWEVEAARPVDKIQRLVVTTSVDDAPFYGTFGSPSAFSLYTFREWLQRFPRGTKFAVTDSPFYEEIPVEAVRDRHPELLQLLKKMRFEVVGPPQGFDEYGRCRHDQPN